MGNATNILLIFLGSFLTFLSTWLIESWKNRQEKNEKTQNFKLYIKQEFLVISKGLERLKTVQDYRRYYDYTVLNRLDRSIYSLESNIKEAIYLPSTEQQEAFIDLISDISTYLSDARGVQGVYDDQSKLLNQMPPEGKTKKKQPQPSSSSIFKTRPELEKYYEDKKTEKSIDLVDIKRRIDDFIRQLQAKR